MWAYTVRRLLYVIPIVLGVAIIVFSLFHLVGGDPVYQALGKHATQEQIDQLRHEWGLDASKPVQFARYLKQIVTFDYGRSHVTHMPVSEMILSGIGPSFSLAATGFAITLVIALTIALLISFYRGTLIDRVVVVVCVMAMSVSSLAYILFGQFFLAFKMGWFPITGYEDGIFERFQYLILPALIWVMVSLGVDVRFFRTSILDETYQDYVRTARAKGLSERIVFLKHILKNSLVPILTYVVIQIPFLILGTFLLEKFFRIPGIGSITIDAINNSDFQVLKAMTTVFALMMILGNLLTDILYKIVDPRVKLG